MLQCFHMIKRIVKKLALPLVFILAFSALVSFYYFGNENNSAAISTITKPTTKHQEKKSPTKINLPIIMPVATTPPTPNSKPTKPDPPPGTKLTRASIFWVGEAADESNAFIPNDKSAWDTQWQERYGGIDSPDDRCSYHPCAFTPQENPFYFALPYNDLDARGQRKASAEKIPWFQSYQNEKTVLKNRWVSITFEGTTCYAQWQDVGPLKTDDFAYVFGNGQPTNTFGVKAGIDVSPAVRDCLGMRTNEIVAWKFVADHQVPPGPWKEIVTSSAVHW